MPMDNRLLRPRGVITDAPGPDPSQLKAENDSILATEDGTELTTE
jgi:hypothetical protein